MGAIATTASQVHALVTTAKLVPWQGRPHSVESTVEIIKRAISALPEGNLKNYSHQIRRWTAAISFCLLSALVSAPALLTAQVRREPSGLPDAPAPAAQDTQPSSTVQQPASSSSQPSAPPQTEAERRQAERARAAQELKEEEKQRVLGGVVPFFNITSNQNAAPLSARQKFHLAYKSAIDPFQFVAAALDAGVSQAEDEYPGYHQGMEGYAKRFGAAYADSADGVLWGNAILPSLLHEDPRYFRRGQGSIKKRLLYSVSTAVIAKNDNGTWGPNYANVFGNVIAGGISNVYYPSTDRGVGLTFERAFTVTAEGDIGAVFDEFWPDISKKWFHKAP